MRTYWERQWKQIDPKVLPISIEETSDGRIRVKGHQVVKNMQEDILFEGTVCHVYAIKKDKIKSMGVEKPEDSN